MGLFDCSPLNNIKSDRILETGKMKISSVTSTFTKTITIALDEPVLDQDSECLNCSQMVELIKEELSITKERPGIICLLTIVPNDFTISKTIEMFNVSEYSGKCARELCYKKGILSLCDSKERVDIPQSAKDAVLAFYESDHINCLLPGKKDCVTIRLPGKTKTKVEKRPLLANISEIHTSFKNEHPHKKIGFLTFALLQPKCCTYSGRCSRRT